ncbi:MAG: ATP-grasp domain-containing protein, partial [Gammaproteobacteria bacterium]
MTKRNKVVIFSDEPGWHGRQLKSCFEARGLEAGFVSLNECSMRLSSHALCPADALQIPGFDVGAVKGAFVRGVAGGTLEQVIVRLNVLHMLKHLEIPVFNDGRAIERTVDKGMTSFLLKSAGLPTLDTWVTECRETARAVATKCIAECGSVVIKPLFGSQGKGVTRLNSMDEFDEYKPCNEVYYLQAYIRPEGETYRDWRVFVIHGKAIAAMQRTSRHWVTNRAQGAHCEPFQPDTALKMLAERAASALDVDYAGVDLMRDADSRWWVSEVNGVPAWQGLQRACRIDVT